MHDRTRPSLLISHHPPLTPPPSRLGLPAHRSCSPLTCGREAGAQAGRPLRAGRPASHSPHAGPPVSQSSAGELPLIFSGTVSRPRACPPPPLPLTIKLEDTRSWDSGRGLCSKRQGKDGRACVCVRGGRRARAWAASYRDFWFFSCCSRVFFSHLAVSRPALPVSPPPSPPQHRERERLHAHRACARAFGPWGRTRRVRLRPYVGQGRLLISSKVFHMCVFIIRKGGGLPTQRGQL